MCCAENIKCESPATHTHTRTLAHVNEMADAQTCVPAQISALKTLLYRPVAFSATHTHTLARVDEMAHAHMCVPAQISSIFDVDGAP